MAYWEIFITSTLGFVKTCPVEWYPVCSDDSGFSVGSEGNGWFSSEQAKRNIQKRTIVEFFMILGLLNLGRDLGGVNRRIFGSVKEITCHAGSSVKNK